MLLLFLHPIVRKLASVMLQMLLGIAGIEEGTYLM
jgi:hypothetical protein